MPLTRKGSTILSSMEREYHDPKKAKSVFYASINSGRIKGAERSTSARRGPARKSRGERK